MWSYMEELFFPSNMNITRVYLYAKQVQSDGSSCGGWLVAAMVLHSIRPDFDLCRMQTENMFNLLYVVAEGSSGNIHGFINDL